MDKHQNKNSNTSTRKNTPINGYNSVVKESMDQLMENIDTKRKSKRSS